VLIVWLKFMLCVAVIGYAGSRLSRYGDVIAEKTGMSGTWIGLVLLATVTSLPELVTGITAVTIAQAPNIAIGDALGSCVFNLVMLVILDLMHREESIYSRAHRGHVLSAGFGVILIGFTGFSLLLGARGIMPALGHIGLYTPIILLLYAIAMQTVFRHEREHLEEFAEQRVRRYQHITLRVAAVRYALAAVAVVGAGIWLPFVGVALAREMGWSNSFVGTLFVAFATSVPELVVTIAALRIGALDMAIGNLLGSNLFDVLVIAIDDVFFTAGPILAHVAPEHAISAMSALVMTGLAIVGLYYRPRKRIARTVGWVSLALFTVYLFNTYVLYLHGE
jgi:cation:H+ antiporter